MIKLPTSVNTLSGGSGADLSASVAGTVGGDSAGAAGQLPEAFLTLLGNRLLTLTKQGDDKAPAAVGADKLQADNAPATELSQLLAALENRTRLTLC
ncbi:hypothetical protein HA44_20980 [Mixta gaviniae]|nr:hypothetical protein HA44_20980 [Mixta gaviniae]